MSIIAMAAISVMIYLQKMPKMYYLYVFFPIFFWNQILRNYRSLIGALRLCLRSGITKSLMIAIGFLLFLEALVSYSCLPWIYRLHYFRLGAIFIEKYSRLSLSVFLLGHV